MKPQFEVLFKGIDTRKYGRLTVEHVKLYKRRRRMCITIGEELPESALEELEALIAQNYNLMSVNIQTLTRELPEDETIYITETADEAEPREKIIYGPKPVCLDVLYGKSIRSLTQPIKTIGEESDRVTFVGEIFETEARDITSRKTGKKFHILTFSVTDREDSISCQMFLEANEKNDEVYSELSGKIKKKLHVAVRGRAKHNDYAGEVVVNVTDLCETEPPKPRVDNAEKKRVELHMHTQMSAMDAVSSAKDLINRAISWGHTAVAITDHGVVQSYPDGIHASDDNAKIKVIYGVEAYLVNDDKPLTTGITDEELEGSYVVFDIETTGLDKNNDKITEIGAVRVEKGEVVARYGTLVNPQCPIPKKIVELTGISDDMVSDSPTIEKVLPEFLKFAEGAVLVAHNAQFDTAFIRREAERLGLEYNFATLDTLILARLVYPDFGNHTLANLVKHLKVTLDNHHRAVDDAKATADVFAKMRAELAEKGITKLCELYEKFDVREAAKRERDVYHIILLAKNLKGIRHIYEMVTDSHLKYFYRTPRIPRSLLEEKREGLIIGSACEAGELITAIVEGKSDDELDRIAGFYDYLEIQPIGNNEYMKRSENLPHITTDEDLMNINRRVLAIGDRLGKPTVATCDVHFMDPEGAAYRKILMNYKGFADADNQAPLYFRTTEEMLAEFEYLGDERAYEVVVTNTNLISDMIEPVRPIPTEKCPPEIEGAQEDIINDSYAKARKIYGENLPDIVEARLKKELHSITTYGFSVMYKIAQELVRKSLSDGYLVGSRGSVGSSFVAFLADITEVNSLPPHYICPNCKRAEFINDGSGISGCDLPDKVCPDCGTEFKKDGHDIPFETFLGFKGDKEPDIDLNFSGDYQPVIHKYTETYFGEGYVFRAGTIGTVAEKTAFGYVKRYAEERGIKIRNAEMRRLAAGCVGVKRTSGQHPGGIIVVPFKNNIHEFCPVQHPADDVKSDIVTTHFDYHSIDKNLLKLDELGHDDPTVIRMLFDLTGLDPQTIPLDDPETMSLFTSNEALKVNSDIGTTVGTYGVPEFGTKFVRQMLLDTKPTTFAELVRISGLSHGTDVWLNNAQDYIKAGVTTLKEAICTRDDIMIYLIHKGVEAGHAFKIMESVRKGKGLKPDDEAAMRAAGVDEWYIESCKKIKYMFPKAHAVAYVTMAFRIAYYKVHYPKAFYIAYYSVRADDFDALTMTKGEAAARAALEEIRAKISNKTASPKEENLIPILEICIEMYARGINFVPIDLYRSHATNFLDTEDGILPPLSSLPGVAENAALSISEARKSGEFRTIEDFRERTGVNKTTLDLLKELGCLDMPETDQITIFD